MLNDRRARINYLKLERYLVSFSFLLYKTTSNKDYSNSSTVLLCNIDIKIIFFSSFFFFGIFLSWTLNSHLDLTVASRKIISGPFVSFIHFHAVHSFPSRSAVSPSRSLEYRINSEIRGERSWIIADNLSVNKDTVKSIAVREIKPDIPSDTF